MNSPLHVLLPSDVFPPRTGGAGWSAHALALALIARGQRVTALVPQREDRAARSTPPAARASATEDVLGVPTVRVPYWAPHIPIVQNYFRYERFWPRFAEQIINLARMDRHPTIIHAQHVQSSAAAVLAGRRLHVPVLITVRDHWPWDYFSTGLHGDRLPYARQTAASLAADLPARLRPARGALMLPAIPYMLAHVRRRQQALREADAVIAVSAYMARRLAGIVSPDKLHVIPNMFDFDAIDATIATPQSSVPAGVPYLLFVGKLERNKGAQLLIDIFRSWQAPDPQSPLAGLRLVIAGSGPLRAELARELAALHVQVQFLDWVAHDEVLRLMAGCELLLFPSAWGEPLSRVVLEALGCGAPILAMPTGGTPDLISDGVNGALEPTALGFARRMAELLDQPVERRALGARAREVAQQRFARQVVVARVEALYREVIRNA